MEVDSTSESENSNEVPFTPHEDADAYRAVLYVNMNEGNIELYNEPSGGRLQAPEDAFQDTGSFKS